MKKLKANKQILNIGKNTFLYYPINNKFVGWNGKVIIMNLKELKNTLNA